MRPAFLILALALPACAGPSAPGTPVGALPAGPAERTRVAIRPSDGGPATVTLHVDGVGCGHPDRAVLDLAWGWLADSRARPSALGRAAAARGLGTVAPDPAHAAETYGVTLWLADPSVEATHVAVRLARYALDVMLRDGIPDAELARTQADLARLGAAGGCDAPTAGPQTRDAVVPVLRRHLAGADGRLRPHRIGIATPHGAALAAALLADRPSRRRTPGPQPDWVRVEDQVVLTFPLRLSAADVEVGGG